MAYLEQVYITERKRHLMTLLVLPSSAILYYKMAA